jgi:hypothetical protein
VGHIYILEKDVGLAYAEAQALVIYIIEEYGGPEQFWKLIAAYDEVQDLDKALQQTFGVSYDEFNTLWQDWLKVQC